MKRPTQEEALAIVYEYRDKDPKVLALARAYAMMCTEREVSGEHWKKIESAFAILKRTFGP